MTTNRREFLRTSAVLGGALGVGLTSPLSLAHAMEADGFRDVQRAPAPLRILILGGTGLQGPDQVRYAVARGHKVTTFNRGRTNAGILNDLKDVTQLVGDRGTTPGTANYDSIKTGEWDVVIDNPTTRPRWVTEAAAVLKGRVPHFVFISTISVYAANDTPGADESAALMAMRGTDLENTQEYGALKALAEKEAEKAFPGRTTVVRPGLIVGARDTSDRFTYWPARVARGGEVLAPPADDPVQIIDARDLAEWTIRCCENKVYGIFNATGPAKKFTVREMVEGARDTIKSDAKFTYVTAEFLSRQTPPVRGWSNLPVWLAPVGGNAGFTQRSIAKAVAAGLTFRPYSETVKTTIDFYNSQTEERKATMRAGLTPEREKEVLAAWHARG
ncbi:MAG TPA: NAD-dependent epimerase/dehydratase family protein [Gemmatimonadaceae bacterium]|nr:NAD-dependent epimerase/dehydratase family protein [Gemmatimonadaceae bacterium]